MTVEENKQKVYTEGYYTQKLSGKHLQLCYEIAPPRVKRYLEAEIEFVLKKIKS